MKNLSRTLAIILVLSLCGCKAPPKRTGAIYPTESIYEYSEPTVPDADASEAESADEVIDNRKTVIPEAPAHIEKSAAAGDITLTINADVSPINADALFLYDFHTIINFNEAAVKRLAKVVGNVGELTRRWDYDYCFDFYFSEYPEESYSVEVWDESMYFTGHTDKLWPFGSNLYPDVNADILSNYTREEAADKCLEMYGKVHNGKAVVLETVPFGVEVGTDYYKLTVAPLIDGLPVLSAKTISEFDVSEKGINRAKLYDLGAKRREFVEEILSVEECVEIAASKVDSISLFPHGYHFELYNYTVDELGRLLDINIKKIQLAYIVQTEISGGKTLYPAWVFIPGTDERVEYSYEHTVFAVNAVTGEIARL